MSSNPNSSDFHYKEYSLKQLDNWVNDALNCDDLSPQDIYNTIIECVDESVEYHKKYLDKSIKLLSLLKGHREVEFDYTATGEKFPSTSVKYDEHMLSYVPYVCDGDDKSPECQKSWNDFWEENYYPEEYYKNVQPSATQRDIDQYTEEELNAMCDKAASDQEKEKCREYNLREVEYYNKRAKLDAQYTHAKIQATSPYNDGWTQQQYQKIVDEFEGKKNNVKKWILPVEEVRDEDTDKDEYCITFPDDLLEAANLKEGDEVEWIDLKNGSYELRKVTRPLQMDEC